MIAIKLFESNEWIALLIKILKQAKIQEYLIRNQENFSLESKRMIRHVAEPLSNNYMLRQAQYPEF